MVAITQDEKVYTIKHHVASGKFSYFEFEVTGTMLEIIKQAKWLADQFKDIEK